MRLKNLLLLPLLAGVVMPVAQAADEVVCVNPIAHASNSQKMSQGDFSANAHWSDFSLTSNSVGYGSAAEREHEITVVDGKVVMAKPGEGDEIIIRHDPKPDEGVAMLQLASPERWGEVARLDVIGSFDDLGFEMDQQVEDAGCGDDVILPFKIIGEAERIIWRMDTIPSRVVSTTNQPVVLVGLYNRNARQTHFMVRGYNLHAHVYFPDSGQGGHVRDLQLTAGSSLYMPVQ